MKESTIKTMYIKVIIAACFLLLFAATNAFSVTLPFSDNFSGNGAPGSDWQWHDADDHSGTQKARETNRLVIRAYGQEMWGGEDEYAALYLDDINGDFTAVVRIRYQEYTAEWAKAGIMVKNDITADDTSTGYVVMALTPDLSHGFSLQYDGDDNGRLGSKVDAVSVKAPPKTWLKLVKTGNVFKGYYSKINGDWTHIGTVTRASALTIQDVGLFVCSNDTGDRGEVQFDNFSITAAAPLYTYYRDFDVDGYGNDSDTTTVVSATPPAGYLTDNQDCDDNDFFTNPGASEKCDGKDNDCDGTIDEGVGTITYYYDGDGDGAGINTDTQIGCSAPAGYVAIGGDCDDSNASLYPGAYDICGDGIDQDCTGTDRVCGSSQICLDIADVPLSTQIKSAPPLVMFLLDDSGSMAWDVLCPENNGRFNGGSWVSDRRSYWKSQFYDYNGIYYNPASTYEAWPGYSDATPGTPRIHPYSDPNFTSTSTRNLSSQFTSIDGVSIKYGHWYMWSAIENAPYLVNLDGTVKYYKVTNYGAGDHGTVSDFQPDTTPPSDVTVSRSYALETQNFANWYKYYRTRELVAKAALGKVINDVKNVRLGIHTVNGSIKEIVRDIAVPGETDYKTETLADLYNVKASGGTPLRRGLEDVGQYYHATDGDNGNLGTSPYALDADGGSCQQAYVIVMTDGYYNGSDPSVGNADIDVAGDSSTFDGAPYADGYSNTLADVAMYYYENDLSTLSNSVPKNDRDQAEHQHMVTYTVSFGLTGTLTPNETCPGDDATCPTWVNPDNGDDEKIDDLWHTAVNGRGDYLSASDTEDLIKALSDLIVDIQDRARTGASVTVNTQKLESNTDLYQGFFDSADWSGDLQAFNVLQILANRELGLETPPAVWKAQDQLDLIAHGDREIITFNGTSGIPFRFLGLTGTQRALLDPDMTTSEKLVDYIRGDDSKEIDNGGTFRNRSGKLGDIVNSSPTYENGVVYVGANDGMMHAFDATNGKEMFAFLPSRVIENLRNYADENYSHNYFVDGTIATAKIGTKTWLVGGLGKGGRGLYGIDITNPTTIKESSPPDLWEFPVGTDDDMGFSFSEVSIVKANSGKTVAIFGNGYDSPNGKAVLYILELDGNDVTTIDTGVGNSTTECNGLSTPVAIDTDFNGTVDFVYAGDLMGNMWKFDLRSTTKSDWGVFFKDSSNTNQPLFQAKDKSGVPQPITGAPDIMAHCVYPAYPNTGGFIVVFGTGKYISHDDITDLQTQTIYGVWDWSNAWESKGVDTYDKYLGAINTPSGTPATRTLSNTDSSSYFPASKDLTLLEQTQTVFADGWRETTNNEIEWFDPSLWADYKAGTIGTYDAGLHVGWFFDLPTERERVIARTQLREGKAIIVSIIPSNSPCSAGGSSVVHIMNACNGGELDAPQFDVDDDGDVDSDDDKKTGKEFEDDIYYAPAIIENKMYFSKEEIQDTTSEIRGLHYWRMFQ